MHNFENRQLLRAAGEATWHYIWEATYGEDFIPPVVLPRTHLRIMENVLTSVNGLTQVNLLKWLKATDWGFKQKVRFLRYLTLRCLGYHALAEEANRDYFDVVCQQIAMPPFPMVENLYLPSLDMSEFFVPGYELNDERFVANSSALKTLLMFSLIACLVRAFYDVLMINQH